MIPRKYRPAVDGWIPGAKLECKDGVDKGQIVTMLQLTMGYSGSDDFILVRYENGNEGVEHPRYYQVVTHVQIASNVT